MNDEKAIVFQRILKFFYFYHQNWMTWNCWKIHARLGLLEMNDATLRSNSSHASGITVQAAFAANADVWQRRGIVIKFLQYFFNFVLKDSYFPIITEALSQERPRIFSNGIWFFHISFLKVENNFSALQLLASKWINSNNSVRTSKVWGSMYRTRNHPFVFIYIGRFINKNGKLIILHYFN